MHIVVFQTLCIYCLKIDCWVCIAKTDMDCEDKGGLQSGKLAAAIYLP